MVTNYVDHGQVCYKSDQLDGLEIWIPNQKDPGLTPDLIYRENYEKEPPYDSMIKRKGIDVYIRRVTYQIGRAHV